MNSVAFRWTASFFGIVCFAVAAFPTPARSEAPPDPGFGRPGFYLGGALAIGLETFTGRLDDVDFSTSYGGDLWGGYRISKNFALELEAQVLPNFVHDSAGPDLRLDNVNFTANAKGYLLHGRFQPYGLVGLGGSWFEASYEDESDRQGGFAMRFGAGLEAYATRHLAAVTQVSYLLQAGKIDDLNFVTISLGAVLRF